MNMRPRDVSPGEHEECDSLPCDRELTNGNTPESRSHYSSSKTERFYLQGVGQPTTDRSTRGHSPAVSEPEPPPTTPETEPEPPSPPDLLGSEPLPNARGAPVLPTAPSESGVGQIGSLQTPVTPLIPGVSQSPTEPVLTRGENCDNSDTDNEDSDSEQDETGAIRNGYLSWMVRGDHSLPHAMAILIAETSEATSKLMRCDWKRFLVDVLCFESEIELQYARSRFPAAICPSDLAVTPISATDPDLAVTPVSATDPDLAVTPIPATDPDMAVTPIPATDPVSDLAVTPISATDPVSDLAVTPISATVSALAVTPISATDPVSDLAVTPISATDSPIWL